MDTSQIVAPQKGKQELALNLEADIIFCGGSAGSAKSYTLLMRMLMHMDDPDFRAIYFRRTTGELEGQGGLWDEATKLYSQFDANCVDTSMMATFPSGAKAQFKHMQHEKTRLEHQGLIGSPLM